MAPPQVAAARPILRAAAALLCLTAACDRPTEQMAPVTGTVTLDGEPLYGASLTFMPRRGGRPSSARTDGHGRYRLIYGRGTEGALPGQYDVQIRTYVAPVPDAEDFERRQGVPERIPAQYNADTTLTATIVRGANTIDFDLQSAGEIILPPGGYGGGYGEGGYRDAEAAADADQPPLEPGTITPSDSGDSSNDAAEPGTNSQRSL